MSGQLTVDEYMASVGVDMLHAGGMKRTEDLAQMCRVSEGKEVLDVGCGYGRTACHLARKYRCKVIGIDISEKMIEGARRKAKKEYLEDVVNFEAGNAENVAFKNESFDAVISEGTTVFVDKKTAIKEYVRVTKHDGYAGLNELSWRTKPSTEIIERTFNDLQGVRPLEYDEWTRLLRDADLKAIESRTYRYKSVSWDTIVGVGLRGLANVSMGYLTSSELRSWINRQESLFREYSSFWGYGLYVGRKP
jgi:arsenite methyltransferase